MCTLFIYFCAKQKRPIAKLRGAQIMLHALLKGPALPQRGPAADDIKYLEQSAQTCPARQWLSLWESWRVSA